MKEIFARRFGDLIHLGFQNARGEIVGVAAIHEDSYADLFNLDAYRMLRSGKTLRMEVAHTEESNTGWAGSRER